jgi:hypothetical protein
MFIKPSGKKKAERSFTVSVKKRTKEKATLKGATGMAHLRGYARSN